MVSYGDLLRYGYDPSNRRVHTMEYGGTSTQEEVVFYGPGGERMGMYRRAVSSPGVAFGGGRAQAWFGGKLVSAAGNTVVQDRLGTVVVSGGERLSFWPWGEERGTTSQGRQKWATYWRDSTGLDYAMARYQQNGRFLSPDPYQASGGPGVPQSWNRYAYVENGPVNLRDPSGLLADSTETGFCTVYPDHWLCNSLPDACPGNPSLCSGSTNVAATALLTGSGGLQFTHPISDRSDGPVAAGWESFELLTTRISSDPKCLEFLGSGKWGAAEVVPSFLKTINLAVVDQIFQNNSLQNGIAAVANAWPGVDILLNTNGGFYWNGAALSATYQKELNALSTKDNRVFTLLHELAHVAQAKGF